MSSPRHQLLPREQLLSALKSPWLAVFLYALYLLISSRVSFYKNRHAKKVRDSYELRPNPTLSPPSPFSSTTRPSLTLLDVSSDRDRGLVISCLCACFQCDPNFSHLVPCALRRKSFLKDFFKTMVTHVAPGRVYYYEDFKGVLLVARGKGEEIETLDFLCSGGWKNLTYFSPWRLPTIIDFYEGVEQKKREHLNGADDYYYVMDLCVDESLRGRGVGSSVVDAFLEDFVDGEGLPCYLEASSEGSRKLYLRKGFRVVQTLRLPYGGPPLYLMVREAQTLRKNKKGELGKMQ